MVSDFTIDEQSSVNITVYPKYADGTGMDLANVGPGKTGSITWVASYNGAQQIKKDTPTMTIMVGPQLTDSSAAPTVAAAPRPINSAGQNRVKFSAVTGFGADGWGRPINDITVGDSIILINDSGSEEYCTVNSINATVVTMVGNLVNTYETGISINRIANYFTFSLLPGDTILPPTKAYGTPIIWQHMAQATFPAGLSPQDIYQQPTTTVLMRGRLFINPILDMS